MTPDYWQAAKKHLVLGDKLLGKIVSQYHGEILTSREDAFYTLARSIIGQQISVKAADAIWQRFETLTREVTPRKTLKLNDEDLRECGLSGQKVNYIRNLAEYFIENEVSIVNWDSLTDDELITELTSIKGIGRWTTEMFLIFNLARPDILPLADIGLQKAIFRLYNNGNKMTLAEIYELSQRWKPYRTVATWYLWRSLDPIPVAY